MLTHLPVPPPPSFDTAESVVIVASQKRALGGRELQLPSMSVLTSKTSTQRFFLRVLQVIIQLRDDTRRAHKKAKQAGRLGAGGLGAAGSIQAAVRQLEAEADAIIQMCRLFPSRAVGAVASALSILLPPPLHPPQFPPSSSSSSSSFSIPSILFLLPSILLNPPF
ncbi:E3 ubiquitin-protein ligase HUWE1-like, partial [Lagopus leucura]|uniref:E3 ubiquitin-protein ligase HUWE1-like n=1 Tax=Lagopus leucura TaxID=30410 RepID=UPI001C6871BE